MPIPTVAIVGRPNVGKSTLFNRLVGKRLALVDDRPGVTRDRREGEARLLGLDFRIIDTAGFEDGDSHTLPGRMRRQTEAAVRDADAALFLIDAREGVTPLDEEIGRWLRVETTPVILGANKVEGNAGESGILDSYRLGLGEPSAAGRLDLFEPVVFFAGVPEIEPRSHAHAQEKHEVQADNDAAKIHSGCREITTHEEGHANLFAATRVSEVRVRRVMATPPPHASVRLHCSRPR